MTIGISTPRDIAVDVQTHDVFWVDTVTDVLEKIDWQGGNRQEIRRELPSPFGLAVFRDSVRMTQCTRMQRPEICVLSS